MAASIPTEGCVTREHYWKLVDDGVIEPDDRVELLEGVIVARTPQNPPHAFVTAKLTRLLSASLAEVSIRVQLPLEVSRFSVPEPDFAVVRGCPEDYLASHPTTALLVIEVADSTLPQDRITKGRLYAAAGLPEYWIVNLRQPSVEVYRIPIRAERRYAERRVVLAGERIEPVAIPGLSIAVADVLPPR